jgi:hypothetical protein
MDGSIEGLIEGTREGASLSKKEGVKTLTGSTVGTSRPNESDGAGVGVIAAADATVGVAKPNASDGPGEGERALVPVGNDMNASPCKLSKMSMELRKSVMACCCTPIDSISEVIVSSSKLVEVTSRSCTACCFLPQAHNTGFRRQLDNAENFFGSLARRSMRQNLFTRSPVLRE